MNLKELRKRAGLTQKELADALNVSSRIISSWESGQVYPRRDKISRMLGILNCSKQELNQALEEAELSFRKEKN